MLAVCRGEMENLVYIKKRENKLQGIVCVIVPVIIRYLQIW